MQFVDTITDTVTVVDNFSIIIFKLEEVFFITETINKNISTIIDSAYFAEDYVDPTYSVANNENSFTVTDSLNTVTTSVIGDSFTVTDSLNTETTSVIGDSFTVTDSIQLI